MEFGQSLIVLIMMTLSETSSVTSVQIIVTPASLRLTSGQTLTIRCQETITGDGALLQLGLYKDMHPPGTAAEDFQSLIEYRYVVANSGYVGKWGPAATGDLQTRLNITETIDPCFKFGFVEFVLPNVRCEDAAALKCRSSSDVVAFSETRNISIVGVDIITRKTTTTAFFFREPPSVSNISQTAAVLLVDFRDPIGQAPSISYNIKCVDSSDQRLAVNIDVEKKDVTWGQGTVRLTLSGLTPGQLYKCEATSRTSFGPGWTDQFGFITAEKENPKRVFEWHHVVLPSVGVFILLGAWVAQRQ